MLPRLASTWASRPTAILAALHHADTTTVTDVAVATEEVTAVAMMIVAMIDAVATMTDEADTTTVTEATGAEETETTMTDVEDTHQEEIMTTETVNLDAMIDTPLLKLLPWLLLQPTKTDTPREATTDEEMTGEVLFLLLHHRHIHHTLQHVNFISLPLCINT